MRKVIVVLTIGAMLSGCSTGMDRNMRGNDRASMAAKKPMHQMSQDEMMAKMAEAAKPGMEHKRLESLVGNWKTQGKFWMDPSKPPEVNEGMAKHTWMYEGKFMKQEYTGTWGGQPFEGSGMLGYDKVRKEYVTTWTDSMGTGIMVGYGKFMPANSEIDMMVTASCPLEAGPKQMRSVTRIINPHKHIYEMYDIAPNGKEFKMMEITYKRVS